MDTEKYIHLVSSWNSLTYANKVLAFDNYLWVIGDVVEILDITDPLTPQLIESLNGGDTNKIFTSANDIALTENYAYVVDETELKMLDITNISNPELISSYDALSVITEVIVKENKAYLTTRENGLLIVDISDQFNPQLIGSYYNPIINGYNFLTDQDIVGNYAYIVSSNLEILDISDSTNPQLIGSTQEFYDHLGQIAYINAVEIDENYAYVFVARQLKIIDISNVEQPEVVSSVDYQFWLNDLTVSGDYLYITGGEKELQIINIQDPTNPELIGYYDTSGVSNNVTIVGNTAYIADDVAGVQIIDITNPEFPISQGTYDAIGGYSHDVKISGDYAYIADGNKGLQIINISDPTNPILISSFETFADAKSLTLEGNYAYVSYFKIPEVPEPPIRGLEIIDISDKTNPFHVGLFDNLSVNGFTPRDLIVDGNYLYAPDFNIIDINDPTSPLLVGSFESPTEAYIKNLKDITVQGNYLYTTYAWNGVKINDQLTGLEILDINNPTEPQLVGRYGGNLADIVVKGNYAYVGLSFIGAYMSPESGGMKILDISDPANPQSIGGYGNGYRTQDLEVIGNYAYLINRQGLEILDISNPENISLIDSYEILINSDEIYGGAKSVSVDGEYIYVTAGDDNLQIFSHDITNRGNDTPVAKNDSYSTDEDTTLTVTIDEGILANDTDADANPLTVVIETEPSHGSLTLNSDGSFEYTPDVDFFGEDSFTYKANDGLVNSHHANVTITINPVDNPVDDSSNIDNPVDDSPDNPVDNPTEEVVLNDPLFRFQNSDRTGYILAGEGESENIRANYPNFVEEGFAFNVSFEPQDDLIRFNRFQNSEKLGTYLYATEGESQSIRDNFPNFIEEGIAFYAYGADANKGVDYYRFQNTQQLGTYIFVGEEEKNNILANYPQFELEGVAFEVNL